MTGYQDNIEKLTLQNNNFRQVLFTGKYCQLVVMNLSPNQEIGVETHDNVDQFFRFEKGKGKVIIEGEEHQVSDGDAVIVPAGSEHNIINSSDTEVLQLYTIYSPPNHPQGTVHRTKNEALQTEEEEHK